jgi:2Fe-2S ferredoxin
MDDKICFTVIDNNAEQIITTRTGAYNNLMTLLKDKFGLDDFGECGGMGRCATCRIHATGLSGNSLIKERNEGVTLIRQGNGNENIRLSCQLLVTTDLNDTVVEMLS